MHFTLFPWAVASGLSDMVMHCVQQMPSPFATDARCGLLVFRMMDVRSHGRVFAGADGLLEMLQVLKQSGRRWDKVKPALCLMHAVGFGKLPQKCLEARCSAVTAFSTVFDFVGH